MPQPSVATGHTLFPLSITVTPPDRLRARACRRGQIALSSRSSSLKRCRLHVSRRTHRVAVTLPDSYLWYDWEDLTGGWELAKTKIREKVLGGKKDYRKL